MHVAPAGTASVKATVPVNPFKAVNVIVCDPGRPTSVLTVTGEDGAMVKSVTWNKIEPVW